MRSPLDDGQLVVVEETESTQDAVAELLRRGKYGGVLARHQTKGRGRFGREWHGEPGLSLAVSWAFPFYAEHPKPYLIGMAVAIAAAGAVHAQLRWPNDLVLDTKKLGGVLTELIPDQSGRKVPVVGLGINLMQTSFRTGLEPFATSLKLARGGDYDPEKVAHAVVERLSMLPEPERWRDLAPVWALFDVTPGKHYRLPSGEYAIALGVGSEGELLCSVDGESTSVMAADALFGPA